MEPVLAGNNPAGSAQGVCGPPCSLRGPSPHGGPRSDPVAGWAAGVGSLPAPPLRGWQDPYPLVTFSTSFCKGVPGDLPRNRSKLPRKGLKTTAWVWLTPQTQSLRTPGQPGKVRAWLEGGELKGNPRVLLKIWDVASVGHKVSVEKLETFP